MPAVKSVPIHDSEGRVVGQYFEPSNAFLASLKGTGDRPGNYVPMKRQDGQVINANRKLAARGYYEDKGFEAPKSKEAK